MLIVNILGGIGNQMFQYAFGYAISKKNDEVLKLDINSFETYDLRDYELGLFNINAVLASNEEVKKLKYKNENIFEKVLRKVRRKKMAVSENNYKEHHFHFDQDVFNAEGNIYFDGYWQSEKYFNDYREELLEQFTLKNGIHSQTRIFKQKIENAESISLHIRRADYVTNAHTNSVHGTCDLVYYRKAVSFLKSKVSNPHFFIFSDDLAWAKENLDFIDNITFVELEKDVPDHEEMYLMSQCRHNIIANSSFSWWGAWLNQNPDKIVIAPKQWFNDLAINTSDLIPESWICL